MNNKFGFIKELNIKNMMEKTMKSVMNLSMTRFKVFAEEPVEPPVNTDPPTNDPTGTEPPASDPNKYQVNFEDLVAKARKEEKDKLYPQIKDLKKETEQLTEKVNAQLLTIESKDKEIADLKRELEEAKTATSKSDDETVKSLKKEVKDLKGTITNLEKEKVDVSALEEKIKGEYEVKLYREQKLREGGQEIIPELVTGVTREDIDASFEVAKGRYQQIIKGVVQTATQQIPVNNVNTGKFNATDFKPEDIANMTPAQWAETRQKLGLR